MLSLFSSHPLAPTSEVIIRLTRIYGLYRVALSFFLLAIFLVTVDHPIVGGDDPYLYLGTLSVYCVLTLANFFLLRKFPVWLTLQISIILLSDVVCLSLLLYANGGPNLQMSMLYLVVVMAANILLPTGRALGVTLAAMIAVIYQQFYFTLVKTADLRGVSGAVLLAISFLGVYFFGQLGIRRLKVLENLAIERASQVAQLQEINRNIIERMNKGVLVIDQHLRILMMNEAAQQLLRLPRIRTGLSLAVLSSQLTDAANVAWATGDYETLLPPSEKFNQGLGLQFLPMDTANPERTMLVMLDGLARVNQQAQQLKLASLGRLTASIAHEIRNPLAAISQAAELLNESMVASHDQILVTMIRKQTRRVNRIIEDVLQLSRGERSTPEFLYLPQWLPAALQEVFPEDMAFITLNVQPGIRVHFDQDQLKQVLTNLIQNGLHHSAKIHDKPQVRVMASSSPEGQAYLDVIDMGPGVSQEHQHSLFEPFFSTESTGTGLGLYLSRAFCEANGAQLNFVPIAAGACFRIAFERSNRASSTRTGIFGIPPLS